MNLSLCLQAVARNFPDHPAISDGERSLGYAALEDQVARIAGADGASTAVGCASFVLFSLACP